MNTRQALSLLMSLLLVGCVGTPDARNFSGRCMSCVVAGHGKTTFTLTHHLAHKTLEVCRSDEGADADNACQTLHADQYKPDQVPDVMTEWRDLNNDGFPDLGWVTAINDGHRYVTYWLYDPQQQLFLEQGNLPELSACSARSHQLCSQEENGLNGRLFRQVRYTISDQQITPIKITLQTRDPADDQQLLKRVYQRVDGEMKLTGQQQQPIEQPSAAAATSQPAAESSSR